MSTRSQLRFIHRNESAAEQDSTNRIAQVYRHSDGYPESVLQDLTRLKQLLDETRTERGPSYAAAQFIFLEMLSSMSLYMDKRCERSIRADQPEDLLDPSNMAHLEQPLFLLGHGVEDSATGIHGDEEYLDIVELPTQAPFDEPAEWTVKVSDHAGFPRWDGPTDEAFEQASWQFQGSLEAALEELRVKSVCNDARFRTCYQQRGPQQR
ncbi:hypothetical protein BDK88_3577 [Natrinema hispanicum]|uniref:Uncharacterized protein n=1 Tax=Natrinema hispanicum TaxID=392421 RepID=A0A482Y2W3_9EURY|nr:hypothetical protein [Natrinema hispanicum]RZV06560.1 hypothetical protein BDK88_3577 [Natrinema hispanicum]